MTLPWEAVAACALAAVLLLTMALCAAAGRADADAARRDAPHDAPDAGRQGAETFAPVRHASARPDDGTAADARRAIRGRAAWVFSNPTGHAHLQLRGVDGAPLPASCEALALQAAGLAINAAGVPVVVPTATGGALRGAALLAVAIPFPDGRSGALVVAGAAGLATRPWATRALQELAVERAERRPGRANRANRAQRGSAADRSRHHRLTAAPNGF